MNIDNSRLAMLCLSTLLGLAVIGATVVSALVARNRPEQSTAAFLGLVQGGNSIRLLTTFGIVLVMCFLALAGSLSEGAIALMSSVVGFMLGGFKREAGEERSQA